METPSLHTLYATLDGIRHENGVEYWYARDLYPLLGYSRWENFETAIERAEEACKNAGGSVADHFREATKKTIIGHGIEKDIDDIKLTRYACYLVALNGDPRKDMKRKLGIAKTKPLADVLPNVTLKAKDLATAMTTENTRRKNLSGRGNILQEHVTSNKSVREALVKTSIYPESLPAAEDIRKIETKHRKELKGLQAKQRKELEQATKKLK
jgi:DNA-damage-inducible protein D